MVAVKREREQVLEAASGWIRYSWGGRSEGLSGVGLVECVVGSKVAILPVDEMEGSRVCMRVTRQPYHMDVLYMK